MVSFVYSDDGNLCCKWTPDHGWEIRATLILRLFYLTLTIAEFSS